MKETTYVHSRLKDSTTYIRLLQYTRNSDCTLRFGLNQWLLDDCPAFFAISYCWGTVSPTKHVLVNGQKFEIRANAHYALVQATDQQTEKVGYYWIDTICICQSHLEEKSDQVRIMSSIYGQSSQVYSCLGTGNENARLFMSVVNRYFADLPYHLRGDPDRPTRRLRKYLQDVPPSNRLENLARLSAAMNDLIDTGYQSRLWIVQEIMAADPKPLILWGRGTVSATWFQGLDMWNALVLAGLVSADNLSPLLIMGIRIEHRIVAFGEPGPPNMRWSLPSIVTACKDFQCTDPRDAIYGICSFVRLPPHLPPITVDYTLSTQQLFLRLLPYYLAEHGELGSKALVTLSQTIGLQLTPEQLGRLEGFHCLECARRFLRAPSGLQTGPGCDLPHLFDNSSRIRHPMYAPADHQCICLDHCPHPWAPGLSRLDDATRDHLLQVGCLPSE